jgi:RNA polymerase sigma factor (sigma-70 family)
MNEATWAAPGRGRAAGLRFAGDDGLARRATAGDSAAFAEIYRRYNRELGRYCQAILGSRELAQDALQNTIVAAMRSLPGETRAVALKPWLYRVAYNESISIMRRRRPTEELDPDTVQPGSDPSGAAERREGLRALLRDLEELPERQRGAILMRELSDLSYAAIRAEVSENDKRILRGRRLRAHLRECDGCREFEAAIGARRAEFAQIAPLPAAAAAGILQSVLGGSAASGGGGGLGILGGAAGGSAAIKSAAAVVAVTAAGVGAADMSGVIDLNGSEKRSATESAAPEEAAPASEARGGDGTSADRGRGEGAGNAGGPGRENGAGEPGKGNPPENPGKGHGNGEANGQGVGAVQGSTNGQGIGPTGTAPGQGGTPPGQATTPPGQSVTPPATVPQTPVGPPTGQTQAAPGQGITSPGQTGTKPGNGPTGTGAPGLLP